MHLNKKMQIKQVWLAQQRIKYQSLNQRIKNKKNKMNSNTTAKKISLKKTIHSN